MDFDYKKYSLEKLEEWMHDSLSCSEATPQEIYDVIKKVVEENYYDYKYHTGRCYELLALLNGNGVGHISACDDSSFKYNIDPAGNKIDFCDSDDSSPYCKGSWNDFWENEEVKDDGMRPWGHSDMEYCIANNKDKVVKWQLPVQRRIEDGVDDYFVEFPDDLLEAANLKKGDTVEWVDQGDGSYLLRKVNVK